ncbi:MAG TPA: carboxypeptidase-like regulatory domain-containing protein, partial [Candidatus Polarisedimenticolia bacterium]|nr:carboxypeptidase-like regulatory domain-containing protein [Candidatus Polarisedimenticolia bacterium]
LRAQHGITVAGRVIAPDGRSPVPGAWVIAREGTLWTAARADEEGRFSLSRLSPESWQFTARTPFDVEGPAAMMASSPPTDLTLPAAGELALRLLPGAKAVARVTDADTDRPIPSALVSSSATSPSSFPDFDQLTGAGGDATLTGLEPGVGSIEVTADGYTPSRDYGHTFIAGELSAIGASLRRAASVAGRTVDEEGRPLAGVTIAAGAAPGATGLPNRVWLGRIDVEHPVSDAEGRFLLEELPAGERIRIRGSAAEHAPAELDVAALDPGERREGLTITILKGLPIAGRILDEEGKPVGGARVTAINAGAGESAFDVAVSRAGIESRIPSRPGDAALPAVTSDAEGRFRVSGAARGAWGLHVQAAGFAARIVRGLAVEEPDGADAGDLTLERGARVTGKIVAQDGKEGPRAFASIASDGPGASEYYRVEVREDGTFEASGLPAGEPVRLTVDRSGYRKHRSEPLVPPVEGLVVTLESGSRIAGQVVDDETGDPVTDFRAAVDYVDPNQPARWRLESGPGNSYRAHDGRFVLENVRAGAVKLTFQAAGYTTRAIEPLEVPETGDLEGVLARLRRSVRLRGVVVDESGRPIQEATVQAASAKEGSPDLFRMAMDNSDAPMATTDAAGAFVLELPDEKPIRISASHASYRSAEIDIDPGRRRDGWRLTLARGGTIRGLVIRLEDGSPIPGAMVTARQSDAGWMGGMARAETDPDGGFLLEGLATGGWELSVYARGRLPGEARVALEGEATGETITLRLASGTTLAGTIIGVEAPDELRVSAPGVHGPAGRRMGAGAPVSASGRFRLEGLPAGKVSLIIERGLDNRQAVSREVEIPEGVEVHEVTIELNEGRKVEGTVTREGRPVSAVRIVLTETSGRGTATGTTDADGRYLVTGVPDGDYSVLIASDLADVEMAGDLQVDRDIRHDIELAAGRITGRVTAASGGEPIEGATIAVEPIGPEVEARQRILMTMRSAGSDHSGAFTITGLVRGTYRVVARAEGYGFEDRTVSIGAGSESAVDASFQLHAAESTPVLALRAAGGAPAAEAVLVLAMIQGRGDPLGPGGAGHQTVLKGVIPLDASGRGRLDSIKPGRYTLVAQNPGLAVETLEVTIPSPLLTLSFSPAGSLTIRLKGADATGEGRMLLLDASGRQVHLHTLLPDPVLPLEQEETTLPDLLKPGAYTLRALLPGRGIVEKPVVIVAGQTAEVTLP